MRPDALCSGADIFGCFPDFERWGKQLGEAEGGFGEHDGDGVLVGEAGCRCEVGEVIAAGELEVTRKI